MSREWVESLEFNCCECGRHVLHLGGRLSEEHLCAACISMPGWFREPEIRAAIDPSHDELELFEREEADHG